MPRDRSGHDPKVAPEKPTVNGKKRALPPSSGIQTRKRPRRVQPTPHAPYLNPIPKIPEATRPGLYLFVWGASDSGQLGLGAQEDEVSKPKRNRWAEQQMASGAFGTEQGAGLEEVAAGGLHTLILDENGTVWSCGTNDEAALGRDVKQIPSRDFGPLKTLVNEGFRAVQLTAGDNFGVAVNGKGDLKMWGTFRQEDGSSRFSTDVRHQFLPASVFDLGRKGGTFEKVSSVSGGENHVLVLTTHGSIYSWGAGELGQLGRRVLARHKLDALVPQKVVLGSRSRKAVVIGTGLKTGFAVDELGDVWGWGLNSRGQTGTSEADMLVQLPTRVVDLPEDDRVVQICGGEWHTLFLTTSGNVYTCGACEDGQLGLPDDHEVFGGQGRKKTDSVTTPTLVSFPDDDPVVSVSAGPRFSMAITKAGRLFSWGLGLQGELGAGDSEIEVTPRMIVRKEGSWAATKVACGGQHVAGLFRKREEKT